MGLLGKIHWRNPGAIATILGLLMLSSLAEAHLLPKQNATMNIVDKSAFFVVSVPASALKGIDDDGSGLLSAAEIQAHQDAISQQFASRFQVDDAGRAGSSVLTWALSPLTAGEAGESDYVVVMHRVNFTDIPQAPVLRTDLFGSGEAEARMTISAQHGDAREVAILEPGASTHTFFRGPWATLVDFSRVGIEHILGGIDHLLFLLTVLIAAAGWRYWLTLATSFTLAHSITLVLSALDVIRIAPAIVEPGIAASIVLMALVNLRSTATDAADWRRTALVFACGLLHGFGFAGAINLSTVTTTQRIATLAGFNLGIEIGQLIFLVGSGLIITLLTRLHRVAAAAVVVPRLASAAAALLGLGLLLQRVIPG